ncbi:helix-turn-helix domain-containing protein [Hymenobacter cellulosilyticus]|uniref:Helix-turn-helix transcriptional regulator n=1 Tax=Hymenobacter cellulosilyticus TaxID=2932248 RepID=A0A8T9Q1U3_9BACT|nr:helix-turn-helix transcriptional regulator [Hymenobacter cellulosilyticus]UOQ71464.1 helix-turn-helix transcriptional regulator [Hymenobacter cellulosilyticus]
MTPHYESISAFHRAIGSPPPAHPLLSLLTCQMLAPCTLGDKPLTADFYMISLKKISAGEFRYGRTRYDHEGGSLSFVKPGQLVELTHAELTENSFLIFLHEDYLLGHALHADIRKYGFFEYEANEALHVAPREEHIMWELFRQMEFEYGNNPDEYSRGIILTHLDALLKYSQRFYKRQFLNRSAALSGPVVARFTALLTAYFEQGQLQTQGLPTVKYLAGQLHTSPRYLTDLLKQETGHTALDHIHSFLLGEAKNLLLGTDNTIAQTAYQLGFDNPTYFSRLFKKEIGLTPREYRARFLN